MRLTNIEHEAIKNVASQIFGKDVHIYLFGSRIDDNKKGGDIDLLVKVNDIDIDSDYYASKIKFLTNLKLQIEDQKIDLIIDNGTRNDSFIKTARSTAVEL